jgi:hypothetical protein
MQDPFWSFLATLGVRLQDGAGPFASYAWFGGLLKLLIEPSKKLLVMSLPLSIRHFPIPAFAIVHGFLKSVFVCVKPVNELIASGIDQVFSARTAAASPED